MGSTSLPAAWQLYLRDRRVATFKNWPFLEGCACTPERVSTPELLPGLPARCTPKPEPCVAGLTWAPRPRTPTPSQAPRVAAKGSQPAAAGCCCKASAPSPAPRTRTPWLPPKALTRFPPSTHPHFALQMADAGFIHCPTENEPDLAQCFFCFKELEGWEPDDDPL